MITLVEFMPTTDCPLIKMPVIYEIMQMYARKKGLQVGQVFDCGTGEFIRNLSLTELKKIQHQLEEEQSSKWTIDEQLEEDLQNLELKVNNHDFGDSADAPEI